ncbi:MAG: 2-oxoglutarate oxidoreductase [Deltaproteobacteria bacterium]|nr:2-oxoglutarate oxidoreductase [Deltaproteobacteria bacterium]
MFGLKADWSLEVQNRYFTLEDYNDGVARWCPGCGDHTILTAVQRILRDHQVPPEKTMVVSGIGCSSRFPHYMATYGFHGLHGRAFPVAEGIKSRRPDLTMFVTTGDGDCCSIGAGHWVHAVRYNMDMTVIMFNNEIYGLTKKQTSPTSRAGLKTNTHPRGSFLPPINPASSTLGMTNASFFAQTVDWNSAHLNATLEAAFNHRGFSFVHVLQRCTAYTSYLFDGMQADPNTLALLTGPGSIDLDPSVARIFKNRIEHDPSDIHAARRVAETTDPFPIGILYQDASKPVYDDHSNEGLGTPPEAKIKAMNKVLDLFSI